MILPNVWGKGGQLFGFSGMDGQTEVLYQLVGSTLEEGRGFLFYTRSPMTLSFAAAVDGAEAGSFKRANDSVVAGDVVSSTIDVDAKNQVELTWTFLEKDTLLVRAKATKTSGTFAPALRASVRDAEREARDGSLILRAGVETFVLSTASNSCAVDIEKGQISATLASPGDSALFVLAYSATGGADAEARAAKGLKADFDTVCGKRLDFFKALPQTEGPSEQERRAFTKCASVMKVNCLAPQGLTKIPWTTPDRWPHRDMWIWDSGFHGIGLRHFAPEWAENAIKAVLSRQHDDGFVPHQMGMDYETKITQPPILGWAAWKVYETTGNRGLIEYCYPRMVKMIEYDLRERDADRNGLAGWESGGASGMDNSPRFDSEWKDSIDLNCFIANEMQYLAQMAVLLDRKDEVPTWHKRRRELVELINSNLWDQETGFYYDNDPSGKLIKTKTEAAFTALFAGACSQQQADTLVKHLTNPKEFWRPFPVASVSADESTFCDNMWRGPVWINYNYFIIEGLERYGFKERAEELRRKTLDEIMRWYEEDGVIYEFYDTERKISPIYLHRKKKGGPEVKRLDTLGTTICDYNWTAAILVDLMLK